MFAADRKIAKHFPYPVVICPRTWDGGIRSGLAGFVIRNDQGWFANSAHLIDTWLAWHQHRE